MIERIYFLDTFLQLSLGVLGILLFAVWKVREHLYHFDLSILISYNKPFWIWSLVMMLLVLTTVTIAPDTAIAVKTMIGLDISGEPASFLSLGWGLSMLANSFTKKKLDKKKDEIQKNNENE